jgi:hypothetical protein
MCRMTEMGGVVGSLGEAGRWLECLVVGLDGLQWCGSGSRWRGGIQGTEEPRYHPFSPSVQILLMISSIGEQNINIFWFLHVNHLEL